MQKMLKSSLLALSGLAILAAPALAGERLTGEQELAELIEGRVAGEPKKCISMALDHNIRVIDGTALVIRQGRTLWVNVPRNPGVLDDRDVLVTRPFGSQLCRTDTVHTYESSGWFLTGSVALGDFVPYRKVAAVN